MNSVLLQRIDHSVNKAIKNGRRPQNLYVGRSELKEFEYMLVALSIRSWYPHSLKGGENTYRGLIIFPVDAESHLEVL